MAPCYLLPKQQMFKSLDNGKKLITEVMYDAPRQGVDSATKRHCRQCAFTVRASRYAVKWECTPDTLAPVYTKI